MALGACGGGGALPSPLAGGDQEAGLMGFGADASLTGGDTVMPSGGGFSTVVEASTATEAATTGCATLTGTVYAPAKVNPDPLYNAIVYVPAGPVAPFAPGVSCDKCGTLGGARAMTATLSRPDGTFKLTGVPMGSNVPLVIQMGRWRRQVTVPMVPSCGAMALPAELTRMPRNHTEGDIPLTAVSTGGADTLECILRKIGVDDTEFTSPTGGGRIQFYQATGSLAPGGNTPNESALWTQLDTLKKYDVVLLPCEAGNSTKPAFAYQNVLDYTALGGRVFATHYSHDWIRPPSPFPPTANWAPKQTKYFGVTMTATVDQGFPKGDAFAHWLLNVHASTALGQLDIGFVAHNADSVIPPSQQWLWSPPAAVSKADPSQPGGPILHHYTFNTPFGAADSALCGRVLYSGFHVHDSHSQGTTFPAECDPGPLSPQEKVLEFMLFDLSSCVQTDTLPPVPPTIIK